MSNRLRFSIFPKCVVCQRIFIDLRAAIRTMNGLATLLKITFVILSVLAIFRTLLQHTHNSAVHVCVPHKSRASHRNIIYRSYLSVQNYLARIWPWGFLKKAFFARTILTPVSINIHFFRHL